MKRKGILFLISGLVLSVIATVLHFDFIPDSDGLDFLAGFCSGIALVFLIRGIFIMIRVNSKKE